MKIPSLRSLAANFTVRIIATTLALLISTTMALNYYFYIRASGELHSELIHHNQTMAKILAEGSQLGLFTGNVEMLRDKARLLSSDPDCREAFFLDEKGDLLLHYVDKAKPAPTRAVKVAAETINLEIISHAVNAPFSFTVEDAVIMVQPVLAEPGFESDELFAVSREAKTPAAVAAKPLGYVALLASTLTHQRKARAMLLRDTAITISITLFTCLSILIIVYFFVTPLRQLVREIRRGKASAGSETGAGDWIPSDFSQLIEMIRASHHSITDLNLSLEAKVQARTEQLAASNQELTVQKEGLLRANQQLTAALSQLQVAQGQLVQSEKMAALGMLIAGLSHEIKNSINFISCAVPLLKRNLTAVMEGPLPPGETLATLCAKSMPLLANIQEGVERTVRVVNDLSHFSHDSGASYVPTDIMPGLTTSVSILRREYGRRIEIIEQYAPELPLIEANAGRLNQVFINILLNAAHAIDDKGRIIVKTWAEDEAVHLSVSDDGRGIKEQDLSRVYDPFFTTKGVGQGTGLGLSISYTIVKNHGGEFKLSSRSGKGSTFEVILPVKRQPG